MRALVPVAQPDEMWWVKERDASFEIFSVFLENFPISHYCIGPKIFGTFDLRIY